MAADGTRTYHHPDHLSIRADSNADGAMTRSYGHFPFGETWYEEASPGQTPAPSKWKFTSYERDSESGLDYAIFRGYSSRLGRFMQADPLAGSIDDAQSMNRYSYTENDPVSLEDPLGLFVFRLCSLAPHWEAVRSPKDGGDFLWFRRVEVWTCVNLDFGPFGEDLLDNLCGKLPDARVTSLSGSFGYPTGGVVGSAEGLINYSTGKTNWYATHGKWAGLAPMASFQVSTGFVNGIGSDNSKYSGGFKSFSGSAFNVTGTSSTSTTDPNVTVDSLGYGMGTLPALPASGTLALTTTTQPNPMNSKVVPGSLDWLLIKAKKACNGRRRRGPI